MLYSVQFGHVLVHVHMYIVQYLYPMILIAQAGGRNPNPPLRGGGGGIKQARN